MFGEYGVKKGRVVTGELPFFPFFILNVFKNIIYIKDAVIIDIL